MYKRDIYLDIDDNLNNYIKSVELDSNSRVWHFHLTVDYEPLDLTGKSVHFIAEKPDKTNVLNDCKIVDAEKGVVEVKLTRQVNAIPGHVKCLLKIIGDEGFVLKTKTFVVDVSKTLSDDAIVSSDEFGALEAALGKVQDIDNRFAQTNAQLSDVENTSIKYGESSVIDMNMLSQSVKEAMTGGSVPVVGTNAIGMVNVQQNVITPDKIRGTEFINWLDRSKLQVNKYLRINTVVGNGEIVESWSSDSYYGVTDYIPVVNGDFICIKGRGGSNYGDIIALYNHELKPCGKVTYSEAEGLGNNIYKYTINNESVSYCRINYLHATTTTSEIMVVKNMDYPSEYVEYGLSKIKWLDLSDYAKKETLDDTMTRVDGLKKKVDGKVIQPYEIEGAKVINFLNTKTMLVGQKINVSYDASTGIYTESIANDQYVNASDYVPVKKGDIVRQKDGYDVNKWNILSVLYDENLKCIGRISKTDLTKGANNVWTYEITDEKVKYIRANMAPNSGGDMLVINADYPSDFIEYGITTLPWLSIPISGASGGNTMFVKKNGTETLVKWKYNATHDMVITIKPGGANRFPTFNGNKLIINSDSSVNADFDTVDLQLATGATDWVAPYNGLLAVNNGDTDVVGHNGWVGGWHGLNNLGGNPTGKNYIYDIYVDNKLITDDGIYGANEVKIVTVNKIQGGNTIKQDGNGREIMQETVIYTFAPGEMKVETHIRALEDLTINCWYGYQTHNVAYADQIIFIGDNKLNYWHDILAGNNEYCGNKVDSDCNKVVMTKDNHYLECYIDNTFGAGKLRYLPNDKQVCRLYKVSGPGHPNSKCYFQIIDGEISLKTNQQLSIRGGYKFYYLENGIDTIY